MTAQPHAQARRSTSREIAHFLHEEAKQRGVTMEQLLDQILREEEAYLQGWRDALEAEQVPPKPEEPVVPIPDDLSMEEEVAAMAAKVQRAGHRKGVGE